VRKENVNSTADMVFDAKSRPAGHRWPVKYLESVAPLSSLNEVFTGV